MTSTTGRGLGDGFVQLGLSFAHERFPEQRILLDVADFNRRARKVYERVGFRNWQPCEAI